MVTNSDAINYFMTIFFSFFILSSHIMRFDSGFLLPC